MEHLHKLIHTVNAWGSASDIDKDTSIVNGLYTLLKDNWIHVITCYFRLSITSEDSQKIMMGDYQDIFYGCSNLFLHS